MHCIKAGVYIRNAKFALLRKLRKRSEFASLRRKSHSVRFAFASLFDPKKISLSLRFRNRFFVKMYTPDQRLMYNF